jgi:hypothetical protein
MSSDNTVSSYDRMRGQLLNVAMFTKASTIKTSEIITNRTETFIVETARLDDVGDYIFVEYVAETGIVTRLALPPRVANLIASQRDALTTRRRKAAGKARAAADKAAGVVPGFLRAAK